MTNYDIALSSSNPEPAAAEAAAGPAVTPWVDIREDAEGVTLVADVPGVPRDGLDIRVEAEQLFIEATARLPAPEGFKLLHAELPSPVYRRAFRLGREMDAAGIQAQLKDGVLTLRIPKVAQARPRRIEVQAA